MTVEEYLMEHHPWEGEPERRFPHCDHCGEEVDYSGRCWTNGDVWVHPECMLEWLEDNLGAEMLAEAVGFQRIVIGGMP